MNEKASGLYQLTAEGLLRNALSGIVDLNKNAGISLHDQLVKQVKTAALSGQLAAGTALPPSRQLAATLGISRNTVLGAIDQLKAEGVIIARTGSGTRIADLASPDLERAAPDLPESLARSHQLAARWQRPLAEFHPSSLEILHPFMPGIPDLSAFPHELWATSLRRAARLADQASAGYEAMSGHPHFRNVLVNYLQEMRGVAAEPEQIIVTSSARGGLSLIASALLTPGEECWVEEPGFRSAKAIFSAAGAKLRGIPVDEQGLDPTAAPPDSQPRLIYATPSHQYPTGAVMSLPRRLALIERARKCDGYIIEDDYDSEFQYQGRPIAALQGLDRSGSVLYLGTFAKSLLPGLRIGFIIAPKPLAHSLEAIHRHTGQFVAPVMQLALADFIERGHYRAHIRRMSSVYAARLARFAEAMETGSHGRLKVRAPDGGLQAIVTPDDDLQEAGMVRMLEMAGIAGQPLSTFHLHPGTAVHTGMLMGFSAWSEAKAEAAFERLRNIDWRSSAPAKS